MNYKQNEKIIQVTEKTLVVGVDIAKELHYARAFNFRRIELDKVISFRNDLNGFKNFKGWIEKVMIENGLDKVIIGFEPTGHYWYNLAEYCRNNALKYVMVNPFDVKRSKETDDNSQTKNDRKDPKTIAKLVTDGRYFETYVARVFMQNINVVKVYEHVTGCEVVIINNTMA